MHPLLLKIDGFFLSFWRKISFFTLSRGPPIPAGYIFLTQDRHIPTFVSMIIELLLVPSSDPLEAVAGVRLDLPGQPQPPHHAELLLHRAAHRLALTPLHKLHNCTQDKITEVSDLSSTHYLPFFFICGGSEAARCGGGGAGLPRLLTGSLSPAQSWVLPAQH